MAVAHSAASESAPSASVASFSFTHTVTANPQGVLVFVFTMGATDLSTSVTYDGVALAEVPGATAIDAATEPGTVTTYFLGSGVPTTDNPSVVVNRTNNATNMYAVCITVTAATTTTPVGIVLTQGDGAYAEVAVTDGSPGTNSMRYAGGYYGGATPAPQGASSTQLHTHDFSALGCSVCRETNAGQGSRNVGFLQVTADDRAAVHLAIREAEFGNNGSSRSGTTDSDTFTTTDTWTHTPTSAPTGVIVKIAQPLAIADEVLSVTYGGVALERVRFDVGTGGENGALYIYFIASSTAIPTGAQSVVVTATGGAAAKQAFCETVFSPVGTEPYINVHGSADLGVIANPSTTATFSKSLTQWYGSAVHNYGGDAVVSTNLQSGETFAFGTDPGTATAMSYYRNLPATASSTTFGYTTLASDDQQISWLILAPGLVPAISPTTETNFAEERRIQWPGRRIYLDPSGLVKGDFTDFGGAGSDWQAVSKASRSPDVPSATTGIRSSTDANLEKLSFPAPTLSAGEYVSWVKLWVYFNTAVPTNHSLTAVPGILAGEAQFFGAGQITIPAGTQGWWSSPRTQPIVSPATSSARGLKAGDALWCQLNLAEPIAQAADTEITQVYLEVGVSEMDHVVPVNNWFVGATDRRRYKLSYASYAAIVFDGWMGNNDLRGSGALAKTYEFQQRHLDMVRVFVTFGEFMSTATQVNEFKWRQFEKWLDICVDAGVRVQVTGLNTFLGATEVLWVPPWYDALTEAQRWDANQLWWARCAQACTGSPAVVAYDLINEPFVKDTGSGDWYYGGPFFYFAAFLARSLSGRTATQIRDAWGDQMVTGATLPIGIIDVDNGKPYGMGNPIPGTFSSPAIDISPESYGLATANYPHIYVWAQMTPKQAIASLKTYMLRNEPVMIQETGNGLDATYEDQVVIDFQRWAEWVGAYSSTVWPGALQAYVGSYEWQQWTRQQQMRRQVELNRVGGLKGVVQRIGQRFR